MEERAQAQQAVESVRRPHDVPAGAANAGLLGLQSAAGNQAVSRLVSGGLPGPVQTKMERAFGSDFSGVRVREGDHVGAGAEAYTRGEEINFAPGRYAPGTTAGDTLIGHELTHVVQQRAGRVQPLARAEATLAVDRALETEADTQGARAARGERVDVDGAGAPAGASDAVVQPKLGFEIEMLVLVDAAGRPLPEKVPLGTVGPHLELTVDQNSQVEGPTPTAPGRSAAAHTVPTGGGGVDVGKYDLPAGWSVKDWGVFDSAGGVVSRHGRKKDAQDAFDVRNQNQTIKRVDKMTTATRFSPVLKERQVEPTAPLLANYTTIRWELVNSDGSVASPHATEQAARDAHALTNLGDKVQPIYESPDGDETVSHPHGPGMGGDKYASIVEIVTKPYEPETVPGRAALTQAMKDAVKFATDLETKTRAFQDRVALKDVPGATATNDEIHVGNTAVGHQSTDASIQSTLGIDIAQLASYVKTALSVGSAAPFSVKHHSDEPDPNQRGLVAKSRAREELPKAVDDATSIINDVGHKHRREWSLLKSKSSLVNMRGLLTLMAQYLRMGRYFYDDKGKGGLDKNIVPLLSRTNLSAIFAGLPADEKHWLKRHEKSVRQKLYAATGRIKHSTVFTDPTQTIRYTHIPTDVKEFITNIFHGGDDGITGVKIGGRDPENRLGGFHRMGPENIDPGAGAGGKQGPIFELRNMENTDIRVTDRFPKGDWEKVGKYQTEVVGALNARDDAEAKKDTKVTVADTGTATTDEAARW